MIEVEVLRGREPYDALKPDDLNDITRVVEVQGLWLGADQRQELRPGKPLPGNQPELFPQVSSSYHMQISLVPQEQFIKLPLEVLDHGLWQCNVHKAKHSGKRIVVLAGTVQALVMSAKVPEMHENTIGSQDIVRVILSSSPECMVVSQRCLQTAFWSPLFMSWKKCDMLPKVKSFARTHRGTSPYASR